MLKRILLTTLFCMLTAGLGTGYFYHAGKYAHAHEAEETCRAIRIIVEDSRDNKLISSRDVLDMLDGGSSIIGERMQNLDICGIENELSSHGEVRNAEVFKDMSGMLSIKMVQRRAVIRFDNGKKSFYSDSTGYLFPICNVADVPVVTGHIPVRYKAGQKGFTSSAAEAKWIASLIRLGDYIEKHDYWHRQIEQIDVADDGDIYLYTRDGKQDVIFGSATDIADKFSRLATYYRGIGPLKEAESYKTVNLKYKNQIICK